MDLLHVIATHLDMRTTGWREKDSITLSGIAEIVQLSTNLTLTSGKKKHEDLEDISKAGTLM
jgi:hypothetical protein